MRQMGNKDGNFLEYSGYAVSTPLLACLKHYLTLTLTPTLNSNPDRNTTIAQPDVGVCQV